MTDNSKSKVNMRKILISKIQGDMKTSECIYMTSFIRSSAVQNKKLFKSYLKVFVCVLLGLCAKIENERFAKIILPNVRFVERLY